MIKKLNIVLDEHSGSLRYNERLVYDIKEQNGDPLLRVEVEIGDEDGDLGNIKIHGAILKVDGPLPIGITSAEYFGMLSSLEEQECIDNLSENIPEIASDYLIIDSLFRCTCSITSSPLDPQYKVEIKNWLEDFLVEEGLLNKIESMIKVIRNKSVSSTEKIVPNSREKSTGGDEDDIT